MRDRRGAIILTTLLALSSLSASDSDPFPRLEALEPNVEFWTQVFGVWSLGQVAIHDLEYPAIVYEIVDLPGEIGPRYTEEQRDWVETMREDWERFLLRLERKAAAGDELDEIEKQWALYFATRVGGDKLKGAHKRVRSQRGVRERFREGLARSHRFDGTIRRILREHGLPEDIAYLPHVESSFQYHARSTAGAAGMWQFTRGTGKRFMTINSTIDERLDPIAATRAAARYLADAHEKLETWPLALTSYNHGVHGMSKAKDRFGTDFEKIFREYEGRIWGFASKNFYAEFLAARDVAQQADHFFPEGYTPEPDFDLDSVKIEYRATPQWLANQYGIPLDELAGINLGWSKRAIDQARQLPRGTVVWLPGGTLARLEGEGKTIGKPSVVDHEGSYVVRRGDTLSTIAAAHGMSLARLREANGLSARASHIRVGQKLRLDGPAVTAAATHVVRHGETLSSIATRYGVKLSQLRRANNLSSRSSLIRTGQKLRLPGAAAARSHVVRRGESLTRIASRYGVGLGDLLSANTLTLKSIIHPGQVLRIPH